MNPEREDIVLMILIALTAWSIEHGEPFSVDRKIIADIIESNKITGFEPHLAIDNSDPERLKLAVVMQELKEEDD